LPPKSRSFRLTLRSSPKQIRRVEAFLKKISNYAHLDEIQMHKLMVSITEAANNAIIHGNKMNPEKLAKIRCDVNPPWLVFVIRDEGTGFDPKKVSSPLRKQNLMKASGRGIFLMRTLMDKVKYDVSEDGVRLELWLDMTKQ
jgi:serine/threonine-protein kinase RsbW